MSAIPAPQLIPARMLSDALVALGVYAEPPTDQDLARAQANEGTVALTARLANALYGFALAHVMSTEYAASAADVPASYRAAAWQALGPLRKVRRSCCTTPRSVSPRTCG